MKALVKIGPNVGFKYFDNFEIADPIEDQCQIEIKLVSICGSDLNIWKWNEIAKVIHKYNILYACVVVFWNTELINMNDHKFSLIIRRKVLVNKTSKLKEQSFNIKNVSALLTLFLNLDMKLSELWQNKVQKQHWKSDKKLL